MLPQNYQIKIHSVSMFNKPALPIQYLSAPINRSYLEFYQ